MMSAMEALYCPEIIGAILSFSQYPDLLTSEAVARWWRQRLGDFWDKGAYRFQRYVRRFADFPTALRFACRHDFVWQVARIGAACPRALDAIASIDAVGYTQVGGVALMVAVYAGHVGSCRALLDQRANVNQQDSNGRSALMTAVLQGHAEIRDLLLSRGANVHLRTDLSVTALHCACLPARAEDVEVLVNFKANVNAPTTSGRTPLHFAVHGLTEGRRLARDSPMSLLPSEGDEYCYTPKSYGDDAAESEVEVADFDAQCNDITIRRIVAFLLLRGADMEAEDSSGKTIARACADKHRADFAGWLKSYAAAMRAQLARRHDGMTP